MESTYPVRTGQVLFFSFQSGDKVLGKYINLAGEVGNQYTEGAFYVCGDLPTEGCFTPGDGDVKMIIYGVESPIIVNPPIEPPKPDYTWLIVGGVIFALFVGGYLISSKRKSRRNQ